MSPSGEDGRCNDYICTASYAGHIEIVPTVPGTETKVFKPVPLQGPGINGVIYDSWDDKNLIQRVKDRCSARVRVLETQALLLSGIFGLADDLQERPRRTSFAWNLWMTAGPSGPLPPVPCDITSAKSDRPSYAGKLVFLEMPLAHDDNDSGEYIVVQQSGDSLYVVDTTCCLTGVRVQRVPFSVDDEHVTILDSYEDDDFIREFVDRLDDMDTENYETNRCDAAETVSRQIDPDVGTETRTANSVGHGQGFQFAWLPKRPSVLRVGRPGCLGTTLCAARAA